MRRILARCSSLWLVLFVAMTSFEANAYEVSTSGGTAQNIDERIFESSDDKWVKNSAKPSNADITTSQLVQCSRENQKYHLNDVGFECQKNDLRSDEELIRIGDKLEKRVERMEIPKWNNEGQIRGDISEKKGMFSEISPTKSKNYPRKFLNFFSRKSLRCENAQLDEGSPPHETATPILVSCKKKKNPPGWFQSVKNFEANNSNSEGTNRASEHQAERNEAFNRQENEDSHEQPCNYKMPPRSRPRGDNGVAKGREASIRKNVLEMASKTDDEKKWQFVNSGRNYGNAIQNSNSLDSDPMPSMYDFDVYPPQGSRYRNNDFRPNDVYYGGNRQEIANSMDYLQGSLRSGKTSAPLPPCGWKNQILNPQSSRLCNPLQGGGCGQNIPGGGINISIVIPYPTMLITTTTEALCPTTTLPCKRRKDRKKKAQTNPTTLRPKIKDVQPKNDYHDYPDTGLVSKAMFKFPLFDRAKPKKSYNEPNTFKKRDREYTSSTCKQEISPPGSTKVCEKAVQPEKVTTSIPAAENAPNPNENLKNTDIDSWDVLEKLNELTTRRSQGKMQSAAGPYNDRKTQDFDEAEDDFGNDSYFWKFREVTPQKRREEDISADSNDRNYQRNKIAAMEEQRNKLPTIDANVNPPSRLSDRYYNQREKSKMMIGRRRESARSDKIFRSAKVHDDRSHVPDGDLKIDPTSSGGDFGEVRTANRKRQALFEDVNEDTPDYQGYFRLSSGKSPVSFIMFATRRGQPNELEDYHDKDFENAGGARKFGQQLSK